MKRVAFLSMDDLTDFVADDDLLVAPLAEAGWNVLMSPWRDRSIDWSGFDAVLVRSPWDYQQAPAEFLATLDRIEALGTPLANSAAHARWNFDKRYLFELEAKGVEIVPSLLIDEPLTTAKLIKAWNTHRAVGLVVKPTVGATASDTFRLTHPSDLPSGLLETFAAKPCIAQPFMSFVVREGEFSAHYFGGQFSHAILKSAAVGDYRVQEEWGGVPRPIEIEPALLAAANRAFVALPAGTLFARIDLVRTEARSFALMEAEIIEPALYLRTDPGSPARFVAAFLDWMARSSREASDVHDC